MPEGNNVVTLDLREMPPFERHHKIFEICDELLPGQTLRIINDHDPVPLYYQFEAEEKGKFRWEYELRGPVDFIARITRLQEAGAG